MAPTSLTTYFTTYLAQKLPPLETPKMPQHFSPAVNFWSLEASWKPKRRGISDAIPQDKPQEVSYIHDIPTLVFNFPFCLPRHKGPTSAQADQQLLIPLHPQILHCYLWEASRNLSILPSPPS